MLIDRLKASIKFDAVNGDEHERNVCSSQMLEACSELNRQQFEIDAAIRFIATIGEELVLAGLPGGDRDTILKNIRYLIETHKQPPYITASNGTPQVNPKYSLDI